FEKSGEVTGTGDVGRRGRLGGGLLLRWRLGRIPHRLGCGLTCRRRRDRGAGLLGALLGERLTAGGRRGLRRLRGDLRCRPLDGRASAAHECHREGDGRDARGDRAGARTHAGMVSHRPRAGHPARAGGTRTVARTPRWSVPEIRTVLVSPTPTAPRAIT